MHLALRSHLSNQGEEPCWGLKLCSLSLKTVWRLAGAGSWIGSADGLQPSVSEEPFYTSGQNAQFTVINGVYQPIISMTVGCLTFHL